MGRFTVAVGSLVALSLAAAAPAFAQEINLIQWRVPVADACLNDWYHDRGAKPFPGASQFHKGLDFHAPDGTPVHAVAMGLVTFVGWVKGYGVQVRIEHPDGTYSVYSHLSPGTVLVRPGQWLKPGQPFAQAGHSGDEDLGKNGSGQKIVAHLHFEMWKGKSNVTKFDPWTRMGVPLCDAAKRRLVARKSPLPVFPEPDDNAACYSASGPGMHDGEGLWCGPQTSRFAVTTPTGSGSASTPAPSQNEGFHH